MTEYHGQVQSFGFPQLRRSPSFSMGGQVLRYSASSGRAGGLCSLASDTVNLCAVSRERTNGSGETSERVSETGIQGAEDIKTFSTTREEKKKTVSVSSNFECSVQDSK